jgi:hypothetical protein
MLDMISSYGNSFHQARPVLPARAQSSFANLSGDGRLALIWRKPIRMHNGYAQAEGVANLGGRPKALGTATWNAMAAPVSSVCGYLMRIVRELHFNKDYQPTI